MDEIDVIQQVILAIRRQNFYIPALGTVLTADPHIDGLLTDIFVASTKYSVADGFPLYVRRRMLDLSIMYKRGDLSKDSFIGVLYGFKTIL